MKIYEEKTIREKRSVFQKMICDICKKESENYNWAASSYEVDETEMKISIKQREGNQSYDGGYGAEIEVDICPDCFMTKLVPWLQSQGANIKATEWYW